MRDPIPHGDRASRCNFDANGQFKRRALPLARVGAQYLGHVCRADVQPPRELRAGDAVVGEVSGKLFHALKLANS